MKLRLSWLLLATLTLVPSENIASTLIEEQFSTIEQVSVKASVPRYEPLLGFKPDILEKQIESEAKHILHTHGLKVVEAASQQLFITVYHEKRSVKQEALLVLFELKEPAFLVRPYPSRKGAPPQVVTWSDRYFTMAQAEEFREVLRDAVGIGVANFAGTVSMARNQAERDRAGRRE
jgi:hypothetical protein